ncbi:hypothetical protein BD413DRAFT_467236 [Trametes elegans]|nr:hypothetical protein BD413DRAFT_467236 [Trametes elegans]
MAKHKKPTPQELYWERKKREEDEKDASLPPGLINHGNTCFMNSTLQGLIATQPLRDLVFFQPVPPALQPAEGLPILAKRSPQLTNGHGFGGSHELEWEEGMPLGDIFTTLMRKAWGIQDAKRRETMSPKEILTTIGRKYDQYLDFRQQDAHEFLRHMLDAMRMEELDIIKKRQPPPTKQNGKNSSRASSAALTSPRISSPGLPPSSQSSQASTSSLPQDETPSLSNCSQAEEDEKLQSFVDMLFGGQLASILVCEKCKKISVTYEDFNDLSLSIKPEDYVKGRKRDRFKRIARKLRIRPPAPHEQLLGQHAHQHHRGKGMFGAMQRASSVPASPVRRSSEVAAEEEPPSHDDPRRRSFEHSRGDADAVRDAVKQMAGAGAGVGVQPSSLDSAIEEGEHEDAAEEITHAEAAEAELEAGGAAGAEEKAKEKKDDPWGKIARRISVSMKLSGGGGGRDKGREKDREREKDADSRPSSRQSDRGRRTEIKDAFRAMRGEPRSPRTGSLAPSATVHEGVVDNGDVSDPGRPSASSPIPLPTSPRVPSPLVHESRPSSRRSSTNPFSHHHRRRKNEASKASTEPVISDEDMAYLRRVLADVHPVTGNPLSILQNAFTGSSGGSSVGSTTLATQALWAKLGHLPGIEECLRMFTAVEILDGENMVGCHRCWKIANGLYKPRRRENSGVFSEDSDSDSDSESSADSAGPSGSQTQPVVPGLNEMDDGGQQSSPDLSSGRVSPASTSVMSAQVTHSSSGADDTTSVSSAPTTVASSPPVVLPHVRKESMIVPGTYGGLPIPRISTTEPDPPSSAPVGQTFVIDRGASRDSLTRTWTTTGVVGVSPSDDSLLTPRGRRRARANRGAPKEGADGSGSSSEDEYDSSESDTSAATSVRSDGSVSPSASPSASPNSSVEKLGDTSPLASPRPHHHHRHHPHHPHHHPDAHQTRGDEQGAAKVPRAKQVVLRKMYKRYLISTPPPILVIHLKRFQQTAKMHTISLSGGFKKLDDFVAFPEFLDLAPFLAPRRADFTPDRLARGAPGAQERCMYRLYAVVVHIGNMLGGHYVAYTALPQGAAPPPPPQPAPSTPTAESEKPGPALSAQPSRSSHASSEPARQAPPRQWAYISDTVVRLTTLEEVLKAKAYICMYERV